MNEATVCHVVAILKCAQSNPVEKYVNDIIKITILQHVGCYKILLRNSGNKLSVRVP